MKTCADERRSLGQHFTPAPLVRLVCALGISDPRARVLDPACGDGAFLKGAVDRLAALGRKRMAPGQVCGLEIDPAHAAAAARIRGAQMRKADFFDQRPQPAFDSIVGNFPFVRQELLAERKKRLRDLVQGEWEAEFPPARKISAKADLYLYFFFHAARFLRPGGRMAVITGNSWLHAPYGAPLRAFFLEKLRLSMVLESRAEVFFPDTEVNALVTVLENSPPASQISFVRLTRPLSEATSESLPDGARVRTAPAAALKQSENWNCRLRAPDVYFEILDRARDRLAALSEIARIRRGITTGLNRFFFVPRQEARRRGLEQEFLAPVIVSLKNVRSLILAPEHSTHHLLLADAPRERLRGTNVLRHIEEFERSSDMPENSPSLKSRTEWYRLRRPPRSDLVILRFRRERHFSPANPQGIILGDTVFTARVRNARHATLCCAAANGTLFHFFAEVTGRDNMGGGFLTTYGPEIKALRLPAIHTLAPLEEELVAAFASLAERNVETMADELGRADRRRLDDVVWKALALPNALLDDLYAAFGELLAQRKQHGEMSRAIKS